MKKIKSDSAWKYILKALFPDFVEFFMPDLFELVDFSVPPNFLDQEFEQLFPETKTEDRKVDKLVELKLKDGENALVLVHAEIQSYYDSEFEKRMFDYYVRIFDHYQKNIDAIAVFTYSGNAHKENFYKREFLQTKLFYTYRTYDISKKSEKELLESKNPFALVSYIVKKSMNHKDEDQNNYNFKI
ncbi:MAG: Rpn family recombination-promoting nuclease/putative transposase [Candidatus Sericytochromatia bacterium]